MQMELNVNLNELTAKVYIEKFVAEVSQARSMLRAKVGFLKNAEKSEVLNTNVLTRYDEYDNGSKRNVTSNMVAVRVKDIPRLGEVLDAIVAAGANEINGITFTRDDNADTEDQARRAAVEDARHKAEVLAELVDASEATGAVEVYDVSAPRHPVLE